MAMNPVGYVAHTAKIILLGVGYRVRSNGLSPQGGVLLTFSVGLSRTVDYARPPGVSAVVDKTLTSVERSSLVATTVEQDLHYKWRVTNSAHHMCSLRPRSPYTGAGVLLVGKVYPKLKATKDAKK
jgi:ribosomal protein L6P/L9E